MIFALKQKNYPLNMPSREKGWIASGIFRID